MASADVWEAAGATHIFSGWHPHNSSAQVARQFGRLWRRTYNPVC